jgi:hypothetical protein
MTLLTQGDKSANTWSYQSIIQAYLLFFSILSKNEYAINALIILN